MRAQVVLVTFTLLIAIFGAGLALLCWLDLPRGETPVGAIARAGGDVSRESAATMDEMRTRVAALETRMQSLEDDLHALRDGTSRTPATATSSETAPLTPEQFTDRYRDPIVKLIDQSRHDQVWLTKQEYIHNATYELTRFGTVNAWEDQAREELSSFLIREFKPTFDLQWRLEDSHNDPKVATEIREPRKVAWQQFYSALVSKYPPEFADRAFAYLVLQDTDLSRRGADEVRKAVERATH